MEKFEKFNYDPTNLALQFGIKRQKECQHLDEWLSAKYKLTEAEQLFFDQRLANTTDTIDYWNEEELKIRLIGLLFVIADVEQGNAVRVFYERTIASQVDNIPMSVKSDCCVASSSDFSKPIQPYFFLQDGSPMRFKKMRGDKKDPEGQMLAAMLIAQSLNQEKQPLYGGYMIGSNWWFTTLVDRSYCSSKKFDATNPNDLLQIVFILRKLKELILSRPS